jgi:hypothetical protein
MKEMTTEQIRNHGLEALRRELGVVGMVRFLQQFSNGEGDYSADRHQWLDNLSREEVLAQINALQQGKPE